MKSTLQRILPAVALSFVFALGACGKKEAPPAPAPAPAPVPAPVEAPPPPPAGVTLASITLGNAVDASQNVTAAVESFATTDTIYAAVATTGASANTVISAKWIYQDGQVVNESSQTIAPTGPATTTFHISKPDGWPVGSYAVGITIDGKDAGGSKFEVK